ncbi:hypothetical protein VTL71DRAFT_6212 [Oculimacula yallundae]|uniref:Uncharacterized protein n=1 Tax=Oculimacula yallundae TaxID=86028 RepID=A0ABR4BZV5_9HELO
MHLTRDICRFASPDDDAYEHVSANLVNLVSSAIKATEARDLLEGTNTRSGLGRESGTIDKFRDGYKEIAKIGRVPGAEEPGVDILELVKTWLSGPESGKWVIIVDTSDEDDMFFGADAPASTSSSNPMDQYLPTSARGAILMTIRNMVTAQKFTRGHPIFEITAMVTLTWMVSFDHIRRTRAKAADILASTICLDRREVPFELIRSDLDDISLATALAVLESFSFVRINHENDTFTMHNLVNLTVRRRLIPEEKFQETMERCVIMVLKNLPDNPPDNIQESAACDLYLPRGEMAKGFTMIAGDHNAALESTQTCLRLSDELYRENNPLKISYLGLIAIIRSKEHYGTGNPNNMQFFSSYTFVLFGRGQLGEAVRTLEENLEIAETLFGSHHHETHFAAANLASILTETERFNEAEELFHRGCAGLKESQGPNHRDTAICSEKHDELKQLTKKRD